MQKSQLRSPKVANHFGCSDVSPARNTTRFGRRAAAGCSCSRKLATRGTSGGVGVIGGTIGTFDPDSVSNGSFNINGGRPDEYIVVIDGAMATRTRSSGSMVGTLDVDTVQEAQVLSGNYSAEYGRSSGGQIRFVTKSGTRDFHGDLAENFRNSALDANTWTRNHSPQASTAAGPAPYRFNQYGFDVGGPIFIPNHFNSDRNKLFFFWGEEWVKRRYDTTNTGTVPSVAMRSGDFSELLNLPDSRRQSGSFHGGGRSDRELRARAV